MFNICSLKLIKNIKKLIKKKKKEFEAYSQGAYISIPEQI